MSQRAPNRVPESMIIAAGSAALIFVLVFAFAVPMNASAEGPNPLTVRGIIYDSVGRTVENADVTVTMYNGAAPVSTHTDVSDSIGFYSTSFLVTEWEVGYNVVVVAVYEGSPEDATSVAPNANTLDVDVHFTFEIPEFGSGWGLLVSGLTVGAVAVVAVVWRRK